MVKKSKEEILEIVKEQDVKFIRLWFTDILGQVKSFAITDNEGKLYFSKEPNSYKKDIWMKKLGEETFRLIETYPYKDLQVGTVHGRPAFFSGCWHLFFQAF